VALEKDLVPGLCGQAHLVVTESDTAIVLRSGDVPVLGTPRLVALCEEATTRAIAHSLPKDWTTVAMRVRLDHLAPVGLGVSLVADARLEKIDGRRLVFTVSASDAAGLVAAGKITRVAVERDRFLEKAHTAERRV